MQERLETYEDFWKIYKIEIETCICLFLFICMHGYTYIYSNMVVHSGAPQM